MLIGIDASRAVLSQRTGTENYSFHLIRNLIPLDGENSYRLYFNRSPEPHLFPFSPSLEEVVIPFPRLWTHSRLSWEMMRRPPHLLFVPAHVLPLIHPARSVVTVHDLGYLYYPEAHTSLARVYLDLSTRYNVRFSSHIIAVSKVTKEDLMARYRVPPARITVIYPGCSDIFRPLDEPERLAALKGRYGIADEYLLYVGTIQPRKNLSRLVEAFGILCSREGKRYQLVMAGKRGWLYRQIYGKVEELRLQDRIIFTGYMPDADLPLLFNGASLLVLPSLYEGFGMPLLEAMACGTPVVASRVSALPEVAGEAALLVDPHDVETLAGAMERVLGDEELRSDLRRRGLERAKEFSWDRCARETLAVLKMVGQNDG